MNIFVCEFVLKLCKIVSCVFFMLCAFIPKGINFDNDPELQEKLPNGMNSSFIWFLEPKEAHRLLKNSHLDVCTEIPYTGPIYIRRHTPNLHTPQRQRSPGLTLRRRRLVTPTNGLVVDKTSISNGVIGQPQTSQHRGIPQILVIPDPDGRLSLGSFQILAASKTKPLPICLSYDVKNGKVDVPGTAGQGENGGRGGYYST